MISRLRARAIRHVVRSAFDAALTPAELDTAAGVAQLTPLFTGRQPLDDACLGLGVIYSIFIRAVTGHTDPAIDVRLSFGRGPDPEHAEIVEPGEVPPAARTFGQCFSAAARHDWGTYTALFYAYAGGDIDRARELVELAFRQAVVAYAAVPCTCGQCPGGRG